MKKLLLISKKINSSVDSKITLNFQGQIKSVNIHSKFGIEPSEMIFQVGSSKHYKYCKTENEIIFNILWSINGEFLMKCEIGMTADEIFGTNVSGLIQWTTWKHNDYVPNYITYKNEYLLFEGKPLLHYGFLTTEINNEFEMIGHSVPEFFQQEKTNGNI